MDKKRGGKREGAGRKIQSADGTYRRLRTLRASDGEWETIKDFAKMLKKDFANIKTIYDNLLAKAQ